MIKHSLFKILCGALIVAFNCHDAQAQDVIHTVAGDSYVTGGSTGITGYTAPTGGVTAAFSSPSGVATDGGNIYVADYNGHIMQMIDPTGLVSAVTGFGVYGYFSVNGLTIATGIVNPATVCPDDISFFTYCAYGAASGITSDELYSSFRRFPKEIWKDNSGNLFIADQNGNRICKINAEGNTLTTITGGGAVGFSANGTAASSCLWGHISGVCTDASGNIYVSDRGNHVVRKINNEGIVTTIAGTGVDGYSGDGGAALSATLISPGSLFMNAGGELFICDPLSNVVRIVTMSEDGNTISTLAGSGAQGFTGDGTMSNSAALNYPVNVWQDGSGVTFIADMSNARIRGVEPSVGSKGSRTTVSKTSFSIFPNPSNGSFSVTVPSGKGSIEIFNILGKKVYAQTITQQQTAISLNQPAGIYDVFVTSAGKKTNQKITIAK